MVEFKTTMKVWWYVTWRVFVILFGIGFIIGLSGGHTQSAGAIGQVLSIPLVIWMLHLSLNHFFGKQEKKGEQYENKGNISK